MTKEQSAEFKTELLEKRREITAKRSEAVGAMSAANPEFGKDEADRANASQAKEMNFLLNSQERALLDLVDSALSRIDDGTFGECEHCGQEIAFKRLVAVPWTRYCIGCQELLEEYGGRT